MSGFLILQPPPDREALWHFVRVMWGIKIPRVRVCANHCSPFDAFADAFFAESNVAIWKSSRGYGGKSHMLALLGLTEAVTLPAKVVILGGSGAQSINVHEHMQNFWMNEGAPAELLVKDPSATETKLTNGGRVRAIAASQTSVRGPHPSRLRCDEIDEMELDLLDAALGQPMVQPAKNGRPAIRKHTVLCSTHQYEGGTMTEMMRRQLAHADKPPDERWMKWEWCWRENLEPHGWLSESEVRAKRAEVSEQMFAIEYDLQEPSNTGRAISPEKVSAMFKRELGVFKGRPNEYIEIEPPHPDGRYSHGADWAKSTDWSVIITVRTDLSPARIVAFERLGRKPWPQMVERLDRRMDRYGGSGAHDATGAGGVAADLIEHNVEDFVFTTRTKDDLISAYINAIESGEIEAPFIEHMFGEHMFCIASGMRVLTSTGWLPIERVEQNMYVATRVGWRRVQARLFQGERAIGALKTETGITVLATSDHQFASEDGWIEASSAVGKSLLGFIALPSTLAANTTNTRSAGVDVQILSTQRVSPQAVGLSSMMSQRTYAPSAIFSMRDSFKMNRIDARRHPTEMVEILGGREIVVPQPVSKSMHQICIAEFWDPTNAGIAQGVTSSLPEPTVRRLINDNAIQNPLFVQSASCASFVSTGIATDGAPIDHAFTVDALLREPDSWTTHNVIDYSSRGVRPVWDLVVEDQHEFVVEGLLAHNCSYADAYSGSGSGHLPDTMAAAALAWHARRRMTKMKAYVISGSGGRRPFTRGTRFE